MSDCIVIGAGPAGLAAAVAAAEGGAAVTLLEKNDRPGRKLLLTGGGRCNLFDPAAAPIDALGAYGREGAFLRDALARFDYAGFLRSLGVETELDPDDGRHYVKGGARKMLDALLDAVDKAGVRIVPSAKVKTVTRGRGEPALWNIFLEESSRAVRAPNYRGDRLILAAGGITYPTTGSSGDALPWAEALGHRIDPPTPALAGLSTTPRFTGLTGNTVADVALTLVVAGKKSGARRGTVLFTHVGLSGPAAVDLSLDLARAAASSVGGHPRVAPLPVPQQKEGGHIGPPLQKQEILVDFLPGASPGELEAHLMKRGRHAASRALEGFEPAAGIPSRLVLEFARAAGILSSGPLDHASDKSLRAFAQALKSTRLAVAGLENPAAAVVTLGGVSTKDVDPKTMESRLAPGLFFAGELLSPAGPCGGFNLLMAFATGALAGSSAGD